MYHNTVYFVIISKNHEIEDILKGESAPEGCSFVFGTYDRLGAAPLGRMNTALILDCTGEPVLPPKGRGDCAAIFHAGSAGQPALRKAAEQCDLWFLPEEGDPELLRGCFRRFAQRLARSAAAVRLETCFQTLINSVPDLIWFKDVEGHHLIINDSFCKAVAKTRDDIEGRKHAYIWGTDEDKETICTISDGLIMEARETQVFEEVVETSRDTVLLRSYKSPLIDADGEIFGTCGIAHDVTEFQNINSELTVVLDSLPFGVIIENKKGTVLNKNIRFDEFFPEFYDLRGKPSAVWRKSLERQIRAKENHVEVCLKYNQHELTLIMEEKPLLDVFGRVKGKITSFTDITEEVNILHRQERQANTDFLTGLNNRRAIQIYLEGLPSRDNVALVMADLDNFKAVNDTLGHDAGDIALITTARILSDCFEGDFVSRLGGDEFLVAVCGRGEDEVVGRTKRFIERVADASQVVPELAGVTSSAGVVFSSRVPESERDDFGKLMKVADNQLYEAKHAGKNRCVVYEGADNP